MARGRLSKGATFKLADVFRKSKYDSPYILARVLLEAIIFDDGIFTSETFYLNEAGKSGSFTATRNMLEAQGFISVLKPSGKIMARQRLHDYVEFARQKTTATLEHVENRLNPVVADVAVLKERMARIEEAVRELKIAAEPPETPEKKKAAKKAITRLHELTTRH